MERAPVLVTAYPGDRASPFGRGNVLGANFQSLPPISSYAFADILRRADCADFQLAIDGIAEICAKSRMSLADEYSSHLPPLGEITAATSAAVRPHLLRPGMRRALTSVPEASSGSSEESRQSKKKRSNLFGFGRQPEQRTQPLRKIKIGSIGRTISVARTTAMGNNINVRSSLEGTRQDPLTGTRAQPASLPLERRPSQAESSLQQLLAQRRNAPIG